LIFQVIFSDLKTINNSYLDLIKITPRNVAYITRSTILVANSISLNYDVLLKEKEKGFFKKYYSHLEVGTFEINKGFFLTESSNGILANAGFIGLTGKKRNHFEVGLGVGLYTELKDTNDDKDSFIVPNILLGYRYETSKGIIFRTGIGGLGIYTSLGYRF